MRLARTVIVRAGVRILVSSACTITSQSFTTPIRIVVGARAAFFLKGVIRGDLLLTAGYDSDKDTRARLLRDVTMVIMEAVRDLVAEVRGEEPPAKFFVPKRAEVESDAKSDPVAGTVAETAADPVTTPDTEGNAAQ